MYFTLPLEKMVVQAFKSMLKKAGNNTHFALIKEVNFKTDGLNCIYHKKELIIILTRIPQSQIIRIRSLKSMMFNSQTNERKPKSEEIYYVFNDVCNKSFVGDVSLLMKMHQ